MTEQRLVDIWWSNLTIAHKERIAAKILGMSNPTEESRYPKCTEIWKGLSFEQKQAIYKHCTDEHGYLLHGWVDGLWTFSD